MLMQHTRPPLTRSVFVREAERRLAEERARARAYLEPRTEAALVEVVVAGLLEPHLADCMADEQTGLRHMLDALDIDSQSSQQCQSTVTRPLFRLTRRRYYLFS